MDFEKILLEEELLSVAKALLPQVDATRAKHKEMLETYNARMKSVKRLRQLQEDQVRNEIEDLVSQHKHLADRCAASGQIKELSQQEKQLLQEHASLQQNQSELSAQCKKMQEKQNKLTELQEDLQKEKDRLENEQTVVLPMRREEINLYIHMSKIRWVFDGPKDEITGYVSNREDVKPFCFDKKKCSQFFIANSLWDSMME